MWIFGYGSLIWKVDFPFDKKIIGYIEGYERKFYQHSIDHRGTPEKPGRVVTLLASNSKSHVWGIAYKIKDEDIRQVVNILDNREKGGYERIQVSFYPESKKVDPFKITVYKAGEDNVNYAGWADEKSIAKNMVEATGFSGTNVEYVCKLAKAMREIAPHVEDKHLFEIEAEVIRLLKFFENQKIV